MYDSTIGRWMQEDPIDFEAGDENLYRYAENNLTNRIDPGGLMARTAALQQKTAAPTVTAQTMGQLAAELLRVYKNEANADKYLKSRGHTAGGNAIYWDMSILNAKALKDRTKLSQVVNVAAKDANGKLIAGQRTVLGAFIWGQKFKIAGYNEGVIQTIKRTRTVTAANGGVVSDTFVSVEGFKFKGGENQGIDLQTYQFDYDPAKIKKVRMVYDYEVGAGKYDGKEMDKPFVILEAFHKGAFNKKVEFTGATKKYQVVIEVETGKLDNRTFTGPFDGK